MSWTDPNYTHRALCRWWARLNAVWPDTMDAIKDEAPARGSGIKSSLTSSLAGGNERLRPLAEKVGMTADLVETLGKDSMEVMSTMESGL